MLHRKILAASQGMGRLNFRIKPEDRLYLCLPIYHITGMGPVFSWIIYNAVYSLDLDVLAVRSLWHETAIFEHSRLVLVKAPQPDIANFLILLINFQLAAQTD